jgi:hypothetical protein
VERCSEGAAWGSRQRRQMTSHATGDRGSSGASSVGAVEIREGGDRWDLSGRDAGAWDQGISEAGVWAWA